MGMAVVSDCHKVLKLQENMTILTTCYTLTWCNIPVGGVGWCGDLWGGV